MTNFENCAKGVNKGQVSLLGQTDFEGLRTEQIEGEK